MQVVLLFPGQGSQKPGMGQDLAEQFPAARSVFDQADAALATSLSTLCFDGPAEELTLTHNAQPALLTHSAAVWAVVRDALRGKVVAAAGHSLGEFSAYHVAGSLTLADAVRLVRRRGELMYEAGTTRPGAMAAVLGETARPIEELCAIASVEAGEVVVPANYNCPGQLVISGSKSAVECAMVLIKEAGAKRVVPLKVSGAFHSPLMEPAQEGLVAALAAVAFADPTFPVYANVDGEAVTDAATARLRLVDQLVSPVRWSDEVSALATRFPAALFLEVGTGSVLSGLVKKIAPTVATATCGTVADVTQLLERAA